MFGGMKKLWTESGLTAAIEGVLREAAKGNALEVQRWYFKFKKECYRQSLNEGLPAATIEERALTGAGPEKASLYKQVVQRLSQSGGPLEEINDWLKSNKPI